MQPTTRAPAKPRHGLNPWLAAAIIVVAVAGLSVMVWRSWNAPATEIRHAEQEAADARAKGLSAMPVPSRPPATRSRDWSPPPGRPSARLPAWVAEHVALLGAPRVDDRQAAEDWLLNTPPDAFPLIEAAARNAGQETDVGRRLG